MSLADVNADNRSSELFVANDEEISNEWTNSVTLTAIGMTTGSRASGELRMAALWGAEEEGDGCLHLIMESEQRQHQRRRDTIALISHH